MNKAQIREIVISQIKDLSETLQDDQKFDVTENTVLFGKGSSIDSLSLVSVIVGIETFFLEEHNYAISLTDDRAMTRKISPFESVKSMVDYIDELINSDQR